MLIRQVLADDLDVILIFQAVFEHLELQHADHAHDDRLHARAGLAEDLDRAFLRDLLHALDELLALEGVLLPHGCKQLGRKGRDARKHALALGVAHRVADCKHARVKNTDDVARVGLVYDRTVLRHQLLRRGEHHLFARAHVQHLFTAHKLARADAHERDAVAVRLVHVRLDLEHKRREMVVERVDHADIRRARGRRRGHLQKLLEEGFHAEVGQRRAKEHRRQLARVHSRKVKFVACAREQLHIVDQGLVLVLRQQPLKDGVVDGQALRLDLVAEIRALEGNNLIVHTVVHALETLARADRPVDRIGADAQLVLNLLEQVVGVARLAVHLVDERENRHAAHRAHLEQLARLRLDALGGVDDHDRGVRSHQRAVGILGEVLVARGVQDIDALALIPELQHRGRDRNTALLFDLHPVGNRMAAVFLALDHAGLLDGAAVKQEFLRDGGFAGVRVRNNRKRAPVFDFFFQVCHWPNSSRLVKTQICCEMYTKCSQFHFIIIAVESVRSPHMFLLSTLYPTFYCGSGRTEVRPFLFFMPMARSETHFRANKTHRGCAADASMGAKRSDTGNFSPLVSKSTSAARAFDEQRRFCAAALF